MHIPFFFLITENPLCSLVFLPFVFKRPSLLIALTNHFLTLVKPQGWLSHAFAQNTGFIDEMEGNIQAHGLAAILTIWATKWRVEASAQSTVKAEQCCTATLPSTHPGVSTP